MTGEQLHVTELKLDPQNRRSHPDRNRQMLRDALSTVGPARSIVIDEDNVVLAGNGVIQEAEQVGITKVRVVEADGHEVIAVRRRDLTADEKRALAIYDNRAAELATWNAEQLKADHDLGLDLQPWWSDGEQAILFGTPTDPTWSGMPEFEQRNLSWRALVVHFAKPEDLAAFCQLIAQDVGEKIRAIWYPAAPREVSVGNQEFVADDPTPGCDCD